MNANTPDWVGGGALCLEVDPELFYPEAKRPGTSPNYAAPKAICGACDMRAECLEWALDTGDAWAFLGGTTPRQRRRLKERAPKGPQPIVHGTEGGARTHRRRGEVACGLCNEASRVAKVRRERRAS